VKANLSIFLSFLSTVIKHFIHSISYVHITFIRTDFRFLTSVSNVSQFADPLILIHVQGQIIYRMSETRSHFQQRLQLSGCYVDNKELHSGHVYVN